MDKEQAQRRMYELTDEYESLSLMIRALDNERGRILEEKRDLLHEHCGLLLGRRKVLE